MYGYVVAALAGAILAFFLDPDRGRSRRAVTADRLAALARRGARAAERQRRRVAADAYAIGRKVAHADGGDEVDLDDATLAQKVMSELFRDGSLPKGALNVNAENGVVYLRGEVERPELIVEVVERARRIGGVVDVEDLLHLPARPRPGPDL